MNIKDYPIQPVLFTQVSVKDGFWAPRLETNRKITIPTCFDKCEEYGRVDNFAIAAGRKSGTHRGAFTFDDTDVYKIIEGASFSMSVHPDPELDRYVDGLIELIAGAQEEDGYLFTARRNKADKLDKRVGIGRWEKLLAHSHELYNMGHLYEAAVAHFLATGKRSLLNVAIKNADLIAEVFGPGKNERPICHQIIEMGLVRLYRVTGNEKYLKLAQFILEARGKGGLEYTQDHIPVVEQWQAVGHAVRAVYMYSGMADVAALTGNKDYIAAVDKLWENMCGRKLYVTGGIGASHEGEAFGDDYELPNAGAYCETCASIGLVYWSHRMFLLHGESRFIDVLERTLYNALLSGVSLTGDEFFYPNALESAGEHHRSHWFGCACCPGNICRFIPSVPGYAYAVRDADVYVNLFMSGSARVATMRGGVGVEVQTGYPWVGAVRITVNPESSSEFALRVRIPGWARGKPVETDLYHYAGGVTQPVTLTVNGKEAPIELEKGYAVLRRGWRRGDVVELGLPMEIRRVVARREVKADHGRVALERGPVVFCAEWPDQPGGRVLSLKLPDDSKLSARFLPELLGGLHVLQSDAVAVCDNVAGGHDEVRQPFMAIPYYAWAHRGSGEMAVWLAREDSAVRLPATSLPEGVSRISFSSGVCPSRFHEQLLVRHPEIRANHYFNFCSKTEEPDWVEYTFAAKTRCSGVEIYFFDYTDNGDIAFPSSWRVSLRGREGWIPVNKPGAFTIHRHQFNTVTFEPVYTDALRVEVFLPKGVCGGILEARVRH